MKYIKIIESWLSDEEYDKIYNKPQKIDLKKLIKYVNPFDCNIWIKVDKPITKQEIKKSIEDGEFISPDVPVKMEFIWDVSTREEHIKRIAWLVENWDDNYPIEIDFGIPGESSFSLSDGNHRLAAAIYLNKPYILSKVGGDVSIIKQNLYQ